MRSTDLPLLRALGRPQLAPDGSVFLAESWPDLDLDRMCSRIVRVTGDTAVGFTNGGGGQGKDAGSDSDPVLSPDGATLVFRRMLPGGSAQLWAVPAGGGEARRLTDHALGADRPVFSADGSALIYTAAVPDVGRYGTDKETGPDAEAPRRITRLSYRLDNVGFTTDKAKQIFWLDLSSPSGHAPVQLTAEPGGAADPIFGVDGTSVLYIRESRPDTLRTDIAEVSLSSRETLGRTLFEFPGYAAALALAAGRINFQGAESDEEDGAGHTSGIFVLHGDGYQRLTDRDTVHTVPDAGPAFAAEGRLWFAVENRGSVELRSISIDSVDVPLADLPVSVGGQRVVRSFAGRDGSLVAVVAGPDTTGDLVEIPLSGGVERLRHSPSSDLQRAGVRPILELSATASDGYPVHGFLVVPEGPGPHPVLLDVHGGPHASYGWGFFDEAQVYAAAGYAVVLPNPRGSSGYGQAHGRAVVKAMGTVDVDDVMALLDAALTRPDCDEKRVGVMGGSYGGFMTSWLASHHPERFVAGISERAVNAWDSFAGSSDIGWRFASSYIGTDRETLWEKSPLAYADRIGIPLLIIHSEHDWRCPLEQGQRMFAALKVRGHETEFLVFPAEGHELSRSGRPRHRQQRFDAILDWWRRYLPV